MAKKPKSDEMVTISLYIKRDLLAQLTKRADEKEWSISQTAARIIENEFAAAPKGA